MTPACELSIQRAVALRLLHTAFLGMHAEIDWQTCNWDTFDALASQGNSLCRGCLLQGAKQRGENRQMLEANRVAEMAELPPSALSLSCRPCWAAPEGGVEISLRDAEFSKYWVGLAGYQPALSAGVLVDLFKKLSGSLSSHDHASLSVHIDACSTTHWKCFGTHPTIVCSTSAARWLMPYGNIAIPHLTKRQWAGLAHMYIRFESMRLTQLRQYHHSFRTGRIGSILRCEWNSSECDQIMCGFCS